MTTPTNTNSSFSLPTKAEREHTLEVLKTLRESLADKAELRTVFRELAKELLNPQGEHEVTLCDNEGNVLGYFEPVLRRMRTKAKQFVVPVNSLEELTEGLESAEEFLNRTLHARQTDDSA